MVISVSLCFNGEASGVYTVEFNKEYMQITGINSNGASASTSWEGGITEFIFSGTFGGAVCRIEYSTNNGESWSEAFPRNPEHLFESTSDSKTVNVPAGKIRVWTEKASDTTSLYLDIKSAPTDLNRVLPSQTIKADGNMLIIGNGVDKVHELPGLGVPELIRAPLRKQRVGDGQQLWGNHKTIRFSDQVGVGQEYIYWLEGWFGISGRNALESDHKLNIAAGIVTDYGFIRSNRYTGLRMDIRTRSAGIDGADGFRRSSTGIILTGEGTYPYGPTYECIAEFDHENYSQTDRPIEVSFKGYIRFWRNEVLSGYPDPEISFQFSGETENTSSVSLEGSLIKMQRIK